MKTIKNKFILTVFVVLVLPLLCLSQNNTSSPYSYFGIGDLSNVAYGRNLALGGAGFAMRSPGYINLKNPASLTGIDSLSVLFEMGVFGKLTQNSTSNKTDQIYDGNISHLVLGHRITPRFMVNYGLMPYSDIGYNFRTFQSVEGELSSVVSDWKGSGGINRFFSGIGYKVFDKLSLGIDGSFYYGPISKAISTVSSAAPGNSSVLVLNTKYIGLSVRGGIQFTTPLGDKGSNLTIGGVFSPEQFFYGTTTANLTQYYSSVSYLIYSKEDRTQRYKIPMNYGAGIGYTYREKYFVTFDYEASPWSQANSRDYVDRQVFSFGLERMPQRSFDFMKRCSYRIGFRYDDGYFKTRNYEVSDTRFTMGLGFPISNSNSTVNVSLEGGQRGTINAGLIRERYMKLTVAFSFHDYWFVKRKFD